MHSWTTDCRLGDAFIETTVKNKQSNRKTHTQIKRKTDSEERLSKEEKRKNSPLLADRLTWEVRGRGGGGVYLKNQL